jgi:hypothetical protein
MIKQGLFKRYFDWAGKRYEIHAIRNTRLGIEKIAESLRKRGFLAKIVPYSPSVDKWAIYKWPHKRPPSGGTSG